MKVADLRSVAFPKLTDEQIAELVRFTSATLRKFRDGETLFEAGECNFKFYVVKTGEVEIVDDVECERRTIVVHEPGEFTGDVGHITGAAAVVTAVARGDCEVYEVEPEVLQRVINDNLSFTDIILQAFIARRELLIMPGNYTGVRVIGSRYDEDTVRIRDFLARNQRPFHWFDLETDPEVDRLLKHFGLTEADTPVVAFGKTLLRNPSNRELAKALHMSQPLKDKVYDLAIVGGGPAGLAAAVYGASEGLLTVVLEGTAPGGQAGNSMRIENYLGFPTGITGAELAERALVQASKFGARLSVPSTAVRLEYEQDYPTLHLDNGDELTSKCLVVASGADYRRLDTEGAERFQGSGVYYAATPMDGPICRGEQVIVVGGGNSAGQAAVFLSTLARRVLLVVRADSLYKDMSSYLAQRIEQTPNVDVLLNTVVRRMMGNSHLQAVELEHKVTGEIQKVNTPAVFSFIGATPRTEWLPECIRRDSKGFVLTGPTVNDGGEWALRRQPFLLEASRPGVFVAGDVRSGSTKRIASAVGEGAMAIQLVHEYLKQK